MGRIRADEVRRAAGIVSGVARTVRAHVPEEVGGVASALTGSEAGGAGTTLAAAWAESYASWAGQVEAHAQSMREAADAFDASDTHAADTYKRFPTASTGPTTWSGGPTGPTSSPAKLERFGAGGMEAVRWSPPPS